MAYSQPLTCGRKGVSLSELSPRQKEVLPLLARGLTDEQIATRLGISARTARAHTEALKQKLGVGRRRHVPNAYRQITGGDPFSPAP